jgi:sRNA-binding regulator protein Hfq
LLCAGSAAQNLDLYHPPETAEKQLIDHKPATEKDDNSFNGTRKLVRPQLPVGERRRDPLYGEDPLSHALVLDTYTTLESSHAEAFYFQKQVQLQTEMTFVLEDGEELYGVIEWYDKCVVKLRVGRTRVMVYKAAVKYLYKTSDAHVTRPVMK